MLARRRNACGSLERSQDLGRLLADLRLKVGDLLFQCADARMARQQRRGQFRDLRPQRALALAQALDELRVEDLFGGVDRPALVENALHQLRTRLRLGARRARPRQLGIDVAELLGGEVADLRTCLIDVEEVVRGAVIRDRLLGLGHIFAQPVDLLLQPQGRRDRRFALSVLLQRYEGFRDAVGDLCRKLRIGGGELHPDDAGPLQRKDGEPIEIALHDTLADAGIERILAHSERHHERADKRGVACGIEFRALRQVKRIDHRIGDLARAQHLDLALDGGFVEIGLPVPGNVARTRKRRFPLLDEDARVGRVERRHIAEAEIGAGGGDDGQKRQEPGAPPERPRQGMDIQFGLTNLRHRRSNSRGRSLSRNSLAVGAHTSRPYFAPKHPFLHLPDSGEPHRIMVRGTLTPKTIVNQD